MNFFQTLYLTHFSSPADERPLYRHIKSVCPTTVVECGIQRGERMLKILRLVQSLRRTKAVAKNAHEAVPTEEDGKFLYVCVDPFEGRTEEDGPGLSIRKAHKMMSRFDLRHQCVAAATEQGIMQLSRSFKNVDLLILATPHYDWLAEKGALLATVLRDEAVLFLKYPDEPFQTLDLGQFRSLVDAAAEARRRARKAA